MRVVEKYLLLLVNIISALKTSTESYDEQIKKILFSTIILYSECPEALEEIDLANLAYCYKNGTTASEIVEFLDQKAISLADAGDYKEAVKEWEKSLEKQLQVNMISKISRYSVKSI